MKKQMKKGVDETLADIQVKYIKQTKPWQIYRLNILNRQNLGRYTG